MIGTASEAKRPGPDGTSSSLGTENAHEPRVDFKIGSTDMRAHPPGSDPSVAWKAIAQQAVIGPEREHLDQIWSYFPLARNWQETELG